MTNTILRDLDGKTRREVLLRVDDILHDDKSLSEYAGQNALLDIALYVFAKGADADMERLSKHISVNDLLYDITHTLENRKLKGELNRRIGGAKDAGI